MDTAVDKALAEKKQIQAQIGALNERLRKIDNFLDLHKEFSSDQPNSTAEASANEAIRKLQALATPRRSIPDYVADILGDGVPRQTGQLVSLLQIKGIHIGGDPSRRIINLSSTLSRDPRFVNDRAKGWSLQKVNPPSAPTDDGFGDDLL